MKYIEITHIYAHIYTHIRIYARGSYTVHTVYATKNTRKATRRVGKGEHEMTIQTIWLIFALIIVLKFIRCR